jgi:hypothetical protein
MLGKEDGTFGPASLLTNGDPLVRTVLSIAVADVTGDGRPDLVSAFGNSSPNRVSVLPGTGDGTFAAPVLSGDIGIHWKPAIVVADFTGDGIPDVMAADSPLDPNVGSTALILERGKGDGTFARVHSLAIDGNAGDTATVADLNGDSVADLAVTASAGTDGGRGGLYVALAADGGLAAPVRYARPTAGTAIADFNLDGDPDIATGDAVAPYLWLSLNAGDGTFGQAARYAGSGPLVIAIDVNGDGRPDVLGENFSATKPAAIMINGT